MNKFFPLFVDLSNRKVVVVGAGTIASRRIKTLMDFAPHITVIAPTFSPMIWALRERLTLVQKPFSFSDIQDCTVHDMVLAATNDADINEQIAQYCQQRNIWVNVTTNKQLCSFYFPAISEHQGVLAGITAHGQNHKKARYMRERIDKAMQKPIVIGSRESKLAMAQSEQVRSHIEAQGLACHILAMKTTGDKILDRPLDRIGGKGLFTKELDCALADGRSDLSVHSLKDMPMELSEAYPLLGYSKREDPRDVLILPQGASEIDFTKPIGCSSRRRVIQLQKLFPHATYQPIRGNVITRLQKLDRGEYGALVLAAAGLKRLGLAERISRYFEVQEILPAAGQAIIAVQGIQGENYSYVEGYFSEESFVVATAERAFVKTLDGGCSSPIAAHATIDVEGITLEGLYYDEETGEYTKEKMQMPIKDAELLGVTLANKMKTQAIKRRQERA